MIILTQEAFLHVKAVTDVYVDCTKNLESKSNTKEEWSVAITAEPINKQGAFDAINLTIGASSKKEAYRIFNEIMKQIADSGEHPELNSKLVDDVLKEK